MLVLTLPSTFWVGDTAPCQVNGADTSVSWVDQGRLRIGDGDLRGISHMRCSLDWTVFVCHDADVQVIVQEDEPTP